MLGTAISLLATLCLAPLSSCLAAVGCKDLRLVACRKINGDTQLNSARSAPAATILGRQELVTPWSISPLISVEKLFLAATISFIIAASS